MYKNNSFFIKNIVTFSTISFNYSNSPNAQRIGTERLYKFSSLYSQNVKTNICKLFIKLERKHFAKNINNTKRFQTLWGWVVAVPPTLGTSSSIIILKCWAKQMRAATANVTEDPNQTTHLMMSISPEAVTQRCSLRRLQLY